MTQSLNTLYESHGVYNIDHVGKRSDLLGDLYEEYISIIFNDIDKVDINSIDYSIVKKIFSYLPFKLVDVESIKCTKEGIIPTVKGGQPKTDSYLDIKLKDGSSYLAPLNIKHSNARKVSFAEYDVSSIANALHITDSDLLTLMKKHQKDGSAKKFTPEEKIKLFKLLKPYAENLVRWCITASPIKTQQNINHPEYVIKFETHHPSDCKNANFFKSFKIFSVDEYINNIMFTPSGSPRKGGFGTGLSWTYATGSHGKKIQFKA